VHATQSLSPPSGSHTLGPPPLLELDSSATPLPLPSLLLPLSAEPLSLEPLLVSFDVVALAELLDSLPDIVVSVIVVVADIVVVGLVELLPFESPVDPVSLPVSLDDPPHAVIASESVSTSWMRSDVMVNLHGRPRGPAPEGRHVPPRGAALLARVNPRVGPL
jgi:hypothetical protein